MVFPETTGDNEGELGRGETIASSVGTVIQWASPGLASLPGHVASLDEWNQRRRGWAQSKKVVEDPEKAEEQTRKMPRRNERMVRHPMTQVQIYYGFQQNPLKLSPSW
jgi:hypothetical protein